MPLHLHPIVRSDASDRGLLPAIARVHLASWLSNTFLRVLYYGPPSTHPSIIASNLARHTDALDNNPDCQMAVIIDDSLAEDDEVAESIRKKGRVIAGIKFTIVNPDANKQAPAAPQTFPEGTNAGLATYTWSMLQASRKKQSSSLGKHMLIDLLFTDPAHHRRGAGKMLMQYAIGKADELGIPSMLEASVEGRKLYESVGFREVEGETIWFDLERYENGGDKGVEFSQRKGAPAQSQGWYPEVIMVRPVQGSST